MLPGSDERPPATPGETGESGADPRAATRRVATSTPGRAGRWRRWAATTAVSVLVLVVGGTAFAAWRLNANIIKVDVSQGIGTDRPDSGPGEAVNILLIGSDTREGTGNDAYGDSDGATGGGRTPTRTCSCTSRRTVRRRRSCRSLATR